MKNVIMIILLSFLMDGVFGADEMEVTEGDSLTLPTGLTQTQSSDRLSWLYGSDNTIIAQIDRGTYNTDFDERFKGNLELDKQTGSLTIKEIHIKNAGPYQLDINRGTTSKKFSVKVYATLPTPDIDSPQCAQTPAGSSSPNCVFLCSVQTSDQTTLSWYRGNSVVSRKISDVCSSISLRLEVNYEDKDIYSCMVNNPISNKTKHLDITQLCHTCDPGLSSGVIVGIVVAVLAVAAAAAAVIYMRYRRSEREKQIDSVIPETVKREEGESAVLPSYHDMKKDDKMLWTRVSGKESAIASMSENDKKTYWYDPRYRGRLQLDPHTGSLIIRNLRKTDAGVYFLEIKSKGGTAYRKYKVIISGEVETVSVKEGDDVTLDFSEKSGISINWEFEDNGFIASLIEIDNESKFPDERFRGRLQLDKQTGSLTIKNIRTEHIGIYTVKSKPGYNFKKSFIVVFDDFTETSGNESEIAGFLGRIQRFCGQARIEGVFGDEKDEMKTLSVMKGGDLKLNTDTEIETDDEIIVRFGTSFRTERPYVTIARFSKPGDDEFKSVDWGFKDRLQRNLTGPLTITITDFRNTDCGDYYVQITNKKKKSFKCFTFIVSSGDVVESVSVTEGESINLKTHVTDLHKDDQILWTFGPHGMIIADTNTSRCDERFTGRVELVKTTGSLTIIKTTTADAGEYYLQIIRGNRIIHQIFYVTVFGGGELVSVMKGKSINLVSPITALHKEDQVLWTFGPHDMIIADTNTSRCDERFTGRVELDKKTGSLSISNSTTADEGEYYLQIISGNRVRNQTFDVFVRERIISVEEGKSVTLNPETEIQKDDLIQWRFRDILIAEIRGGTGETHDDDDERFNGRLKLDEKTGSLTITNMRIASHAGVYKLQINSSRGNTIKTFRVVVVYIVNSSGNRENDVTVVMPLLNEEDLDGENEHEGTSSL